MRLAILCAFALLVSCSHAMPPPKEDSHAGVDHQYDDARILGVVASEVRKDAVVSAKSRPVSTVIVYEETLDVTSARLKESAEIQRFEADAISDLSRRNPARIGRWETQEGVRFVSAEERSLLFPISIDDPILAWQGFRERFPDAAGLLHLTLPGYSPDGRHAVVYCELRAGTLGGKARLIQLRRVREDWTIERMKVLTAY